MKLHNKKTREIGNLLPYGGEDGKIWVWIDNKSRPEYRYNSLAELNEEWCDYKEPKEYWYIAELCAGLQKKQDTDNGEDRFNKQIGNYFDSREEAEKAVEKLKIYNKLKQKGFRFTGYTHKDRGRLDELEIYCQLGECPENIEEMDDVRLLFGGEE